MVCWIDYHVGLLVIAALIALVGLLALLRPLGFPAPPGLIGLVALLGLLRPPDLVALVALLGLFHPLWHKKNIAPRRFLLRAI